MCVQLNLAAHLEEFLRLHPNSKHLFADADDEEAPKRLKQNHRNNVDQHVFKNQEFMDMALESDFHAGLGTHSFRKGAADEARKLGALPDKIEIRGRWKPQGRRVMFRCIDATQTHIDANVAAPLCPGGVIKHKLKASQTDHITDDWLFTQCVPDMRRRCPNDRRLCRALALATLFCCCDPALRANLPELQVGRVTACLQGVEHGANCVERVPLHVCQVNGNLCVDEVTQAGGGEAAGQAAGVAHAVGGANQGQVLQSILLNQQRSNTMQAVMQVQMDDGFASMKQRMDRRFVMLNDNVRCFGGTIQGGFARQAPVQAGNRQAARGKSPLPQPPNPPVGIVHRDPTVELAPNLHTLEELWTEWKFGTGGRKPVQLFSCAERGGHGGKAKKMKFCRRLKIHLLLQKPVDEGRVTAQAIAAVKLRCGAAKSVTQFSEAIRRIPNHPSLQPLRQCRQDPPLAPADRGRGRGAGRGVVHKLHQLRVDQRPSSEGPMHQGWWVLRSQFKGRCSLRQMESVLAIRRLCSNRLDRRRKSGRQACKAGSWLTACKDSSFCLIPQLLMSLHLFCTTSSFALRAVREAHAHGTTATAASQLCAIGTMSYMCGNILCHCHFLLLSQQ